MAIGMCSPGNISIASIRRRKRCARSRLTGSRGGRAGFRLTGDSSIRRLCTGTRACRAVRLRGGAVHVRADVLGLAPGAKQCRWQQVGENHGRVVTYREYVTHRTPPRQLAREIIDSSIARDGRSSRKSTRSIFRRMLLRVARTKLRLRSRWATYSSRLDCLGPCRRTTIAWAVGC